MKIKHYINLMLNKQTRFSVLSKYGFYDWMSDAKHIRKSWRLKMGYELDLSNPRTFNEKLQWLKLYNRMPEYAMMVDKFAVKQYVADRIGGDYVIPTVGGPWNSFDEIDFEKLPKQFVLKTTHDCGGVVVCKDKATFHKENARAFLNKHLRRNYYYTCREWPYKNVKPSLFAEAFMKDGDRDFLPVYKIMCFHGVPKIIQTIQNDKQPDETIDYFDTSWNRLDMKQNFPNSVVPLSKPECMEEMLSLAEQLSKDAPFLRVDLYVVNGKIYFSEYTFFSDAGFEKFTPETWDEELGELIQLSCQESIEKI